MGVGGPDRTAFEWQGNWKAFLPIALTNGLLTIVTLGIYRFWATARERQYFWANTRFIDDQLEWTGNGKEVFIGFLVFFVALTLVSFSAIFLGPWILLLIPVYFWLLGVAKFRSIRYRLSRTQWHGIRGGSEDNGFRFGLTYIWRTIVGSIVPFMVPWMMTNLWNKRWNKMSFGPHAFKSNAQWNNVIGAYIFASFAPIFLFVPSALLAGFVFSAIGENGNALGGAIALLVSGAVFASIFVFPIIYYAAFFREAVSKLELHTLYFEFSAKTLDWVKLYAGHVGIWLVSAIPGVLALASLDASAGLSPEILNQGEEFPFALALVAVLFAVPIILTMPFIRYRNWRFFIMNMEASGEVNLEALTQSTTRDNARGEGLLDALDVGAL
jgi:uncharacterized membrane protein YjgN (DUF898 family)